MKDDKGSSTLGILVVVAIVVIAAAIAGGYHFGKSSKTKDKSGVENDIAENCIFSSAATGLDTQTSVCMTENTVFHCQIYHAACHFTSQSYGTVAVLHKALTDMDILGRSLMLFAHVDLTALDCNTVISQGKTHTQDLHIFAGFRIQSVGVGGIAGILHGDTDEFQIIAEIGMQGPGRRIAEGHSL